MRSKVKALRTAIEQGDLDQARGMLTETLSILDHSVKLGVVHGNTVARTKSRLTRAVSRIGADS
jgi:ribosomal protein S20